MISNKTCQKAALVESKGTLIF